MLISGERSAIVPNGEGVRCEKKERIGCEKHRITTPKIRTSEVVGGYGQLLGGFRQSCCHRT